MVDMSQPQPTPHTMSADEALRATFAEILPNADVVSCDAASSSTMHGPVFTGDGTWLPPTHAVYDEDGCSIGRGLSREEAMANAIVRAYEAERKAHAELLAAVAVWRAATSALMGPS